MCGRATYKLTWQDIVALYRLTLDQPAVNTRALQGLPDQLSRDDVFLIAVDIAKLPSVPPQILKDIPRPPNTASRDDWASTKPVFTKC
jgi:hypothetical protein